MIFLKGHGTRIQVGSTDAGYDLEQAMAAACGYAAGEVYPDPATIPLASFGFFFPDGESTPHAHNIAERLDALADAMVDHAPPEEDNSDIPAFFTYFGQFLDHDITAGTDREAGFSEIDVAAPALGQATKPMVTKTLANLRSGAIDFDSLYGTNTHIGSIGERLRAAMRFPSEPAKMLLGVSVLFEDCRPDMPDDPATDLVRLSRITDPAREIIPLADFDALTGDLAERFHDADGKTILGRALIGDMRNDENLAVAQVHAMFLRLHNKIVDQVHGTGIDPHDQEAVFDWARAEHTAIYQWLIVNAYLPAICDEDVLADVIAHEAPVYKQFLERVNGGFRRFMPMPLEFSVAAFRFGHTQARPDYDWNLFFGRGETDCRGAQDRATFRDLQRFTGSGFAGVAPSLTQLPTNWIPEMERFLNVGEEWFADRNTRKVDTFLAPDLTDLGNEAQGISGIMRNLPIRNLRRGHLLNVPTAQACIASLGVMGVHVAPLTQSQLTAGPTGEALKVAGLEDQTPLWFYVLKEAEQASDGKRLGPLGSRLVAETLAGLVIHGPNTYWARSGTDPNGRWHPQDGVRIDGEAIESFPAMMRAVGYL